MKIKQAGRGNTFTEINIGHIENFNPNVKKVYNNVSDRPITAAELIKGLSNATQSLTSAYVPIRFKGKEFHQFYANLCEENGNYYIDLTIR